MPLRNRARHFSGVARSRFRALVCVSAFFRDPFGISAGQCLIDREEIYIFHFSRGDIRRGAPPRSLIVAPLIIVRDGKTTSGEISRAFYR
jgi:uncharacterized protein (DUF3820 family)